MFYVFEGPDSVGKSTISAAFVEKLRVASSHPVHHWSFPGRNEGTLGLLVYRLHHAPKELGVNSITPASVQALHIAAHIDAIEARILPAIERGDSVVLDRFWWSTLVYGIVGGASVDTLQAMIEVERKAWRGVLPNIAFLIERPSPFKLRSDERLPDWYRLKNEYERLAQHESKQYPVIRVRNDGALPETITQLLASVSIQIV